MNNTQNFSYPLGVFLCVIGAFVGEVGAVTIIDFEGEPDFTNVSPTNPLEMDGFVFTPSNDRAARIDSSVFQMLGNPTDFFGFDTGNTIILTAMNSFSLFSIDVAIISLASSDMTDFTITGFRTGLPNLVSSTSEVSTTQTLSLNWTGLDSVSIEVTDDGGIDNLSVETVPEPSSTLLFGFSTLGCLLWRRREP